MNTMMQFYSCETLYEAVTLNKQMCEAFAGSECFDDDKLVVTPVIPLFDMTNGPFGPFEEPVAYGFRVYFDTVEFNDKINVNVVVDEHNVVRDLHSLNTLNLEKR